MGYGCINSARIIYSAMYHVENGRSLIVNFDRSGNDIYGRVVHSDPKRRVITTQIGETFYYCGEAMKIVKAEPYGQNWLTEEDRAKYMK